MPNANTLLSSIRPFVSTLIDRFVPEHVRTNHPKFVQFIQAYLEFLETSNQSSYFQNTLPEQRSFELQESIFLSRIENEIGLFVPREYAASPRVFYNKITDLWRSKGSEEGIKLFFRLFLGEIVQIRLPWDNVLKPSDGRWITDRRLRVSVIRGNPEDFIGRRIVQLENFALATIIKIEKKEYEDGIIYELSLDINQIVGEFVPKDRIIVDDPDIDLEAEVYNSITDIEILQKGQGYSVGSKVQIENLSSVTFEGRISKVDEFGGIEEIVIVDYGAGSTPDHILEIKTEGFVFRNFVVFDYISDNIRNQVLGDSVDFSENVFLSISDYTINVYNQFNQTLGDNIGFSENVSLLKSDYSSEIYFEEIYTLSNSFSVNENSLVLNPILEQSEFTQDPSLSEVYFEELYVLGSVSLTQTENSPIINLEVSTEDISVRGSDILGSGNFTILDENGFGAELKLNFGAIVQKTQYYAGVQGQLSESIVLQDSNFYQKFAYEVISSLSIEQWLDPLKKTVHPAGIKPFSLIAINNDILPRPEFILNQISSLFLDPTAPGIPFTSVFYKFTKVVSSEISIADPIEKDFVKPISDFIEMELNEEVDKTFTKGLINPIAINSENKNKDFIKTIAAKPGYTDDPIQGAYFAEKYGESPDDLFVSDFDVNKQTIKPLNNSVLIAESGKIFKINDFAPSYFEEQYSESGIITF